MDISAVRRVIKISSNEGSGCPHCDFSFSYENVPRSINHLIADHGYALLHAGSETIHGSDGAPWHTTVAMLGSDNPPPIKAAPTFKIELPDNGR